MRYLDRDESNSIKGFLVFLIVLGHIHIFTFNIDNLFSYLYQFHLMIFFILPFFYNTTKKLTYKNLQTLIIRNWYPYTLFFIALFLAFSLTKSEFNLNLDLINAYINGTHGPLERNVGCMFLWFLPAFGTFSILKLFADNNTKFRIIINILSIGFMIITFFLISPAQNEHLKVILPFGLYFALLYFGYGFLATKLIQMSSKIHYFISILFIGFSVLHFYTNTPPIIKLLFPLMAFITIYTILPYIKKSLLTQQLGKFSLIIYLTNILVYNAIEHIFPKTILFGFIDYALTISICYFIAYYINKISKLNALLFPRDINDIKNISTNIIFWK